MNQINLIDIGCMYTHTYNNSHIFLWFEALFEALTDYFTHYSIIFFIHLYIFI